MGDICRLCCSTKFVNHYIFDDDNSVYLKMSLYLPIKVVKNDRLPQKICDDCSCKIDEFYQFYNQTIEVQHRLRLVYATVLPLDNSVDLTVIKQNSNSPPPLNVFYNNQSTQTESVTDISTKIKDSGASQPVKIEPVSKPGSPVKIESVNDDLDDDYVPDVPSDNSEDTLLIHLKKPKKSRKDKEEPKNGEVKENKRGRKSKGKAKDWKTLVPKKLLNDNMLLSEQCAEMGLDAVKQEVLDDVHGLSAMLGQLQQVKEELSEADIHICCMCFTRCSSKSELLQHYKSHGAKSEAAEDPPAAPAPPDQRPLRCHRCQKVLEADEWAAHWRRHWERDRRPYRCALCEKTFRDHHQILKHGLTHKSGEVGGGGVGVGGGGGGEPAKRFVCDLCPESFVYMRCLLAHRTRAHPEAAARALTLRCGECARSFAHLNSLRRHLRAHSGERNFLCSVCGKALSSREHLKFHLRIHTGYKPHVCKTCGKGFVKKCNLTLHERVHSGEKPHVCAHCGKAFSQRSTLVIHERYHSGARPYTCGLCGRGFVAKGLLSMHLKTTCVDAREFRPRLVSAPASVQGAALETITVHKS